MRYTKKMILGATIGALFLCMLTGGTALYTSAQYLYTPWSFPPVFAQQGSLNFNMFKTPTRVDVIFWGEEENVLLYPENKDLYDDYAKRMGDYCARILEEHTEQTVYNISAHLGEEWYKLCFQAEYTIMVLDVSREPGCVRFKNMDYQISKELYHEIVHYIQSTYVVTEQI